LQTALEASRPMLEKVQKSLGFIHGISSRQIHKRSGNNTLKDPSTFWKPLANFRLSVPFQA
jgi:hypothetical protein